MGYVMFKGRLSVGLTIGDTVNLLDFHSDGYTAIDEHLEGRQLMIVEPKAQRAQFYGSVHHREHPRAVRVKGEKCDISASLFHLSP